MIPLFFVVVCGEGLVAFLFMVKIGPLRELVMKGLDEVKARRGTVLTIAGTIFVILLSCLFSVVGIQNKGSKHGAMAPMDQVIWRTNLLEATLMGFSLFLGFLIDRMHHFMRRLSKLRSSTGVLTREVERLEREKVRMREMGERAAEEAKQLQQEISSLIDDLEMVKVRLRRRTCCSRRLRLTSSLCRNKRRIFCSSTTVISKITRFCRFRLLDSMAESEDSLGGIN
ncbi:hypothetical protein AAHA92_01424 [Salvia divinorum]|uniref:Endoplasmic reticulum transmembrane protein n=1 Tax=Salvia divinorum TaxID=28513 RepID=A0ABD1IDA8_SALDI